MTTIREAKKLWQRQKSKFAIQRDTRTAVLGDGRGTSTANIEVPNAPDFVWARDTAEATIFYPILNRVGVPLVHDLPVLLGYTDEEPNIEQVIRIYSEGLGGNTPITSVPTTAAHHQQHEFGGGDEVEIEGRLFQPGLVHPTVPASMQVLINGFVYYYDEWQKFNGGISKSFNEFLPSAGYKVYVLVAFDPDIRSVVYIPGLPYAAGSAQDLYPTFEDVPAPSGNEYPLGWIYLEATTTVIDWTTTNDNIGDARLHVGFPARNIMDRLAQLEGLSGSDPNLALTGAAAFSVTDHSGSESSSSETEIDSNDANIPGINFLERSNDPSAPSTGHWILYTKSGGLHIIDDAGTVAAVNSASSSIPVDGWITAGVTWNYASADSPTFTFTITGVDKTDTYQPGMRVKVTQSTGGTKYFIITKVAFSTSTTVTVYGGTDYTLNNEAISSPYYSPVKAPFGFPLSPSKWTVEVTDATNRSQGSPTANTWYNIGTETISIPIGSWKVSYQVAILTTYSSGGEIDVTLSTANNSQSDARWTAFGYVGTLYALSFMRENYLSPTSKTSYYLNARVTASGFTDIYFYNSVSTLILRATCAYL